MSYYHRFLQIQAYKHDASFHRLWSHGLVVRDDEDYIVEVATRVRVVESDNHVWHTKDLGVFILSKKEWFNVIATFKDGGVKFYINIASPSIVDKGFIKFIDYDLDLKVFPDGTSKVLDVNEFKGHCAQYGYSEELQKVLYHALDETSKKVNGKIDPFNEETIQRYLKDYEDYVSKQEMKDKQKPH